MKIEDKNVVSIKYVLTDSENNVIDKSEDGKFSFLIGAQNIIPGLENALMSKAVGDKFDVSIPPAEAYGEYNKDLVHKVPRTQFPADVEIEVGMQFQGQTADGQMTIVKVAEVADDHIFVDNNHPLAGVQLNFAVEVTNIREATDTEIEHGHVHGEGGHHH
ncbi:MAG TPA: peptidylprolyl isomerase [Gammaproteobacteria bacterium]|jgi:FKBP-type peptidyl-prolyl cis-trans isomerase SlyD|nr:peptidylprolyl isomerase [Xanthomonadales bacterium]MCB1603565.1 peptidylprolyl isomerase [Xanthomonadales bacterium]HOP23457.1 peptidylprolyl isomerase [Gammaproteobacteria bacterium]HPI96787.1 peptidylprolyl isomerase [Gammaproteobacteria bacterium]HPQ88332.1 peptidylprolyl isomerase [Gammaproteobacteria bacterium]